MLDLELASVASKEYDPENIPIRGGDGGSGYRSSAKDLTVRPAKLSSSVAIRPIKNNLVNSSDSITGRKEEQNVLSKLICGRNQLYMEPFDVFDPNHPLRGKKRFNENFRPLRSKINIKIGAAEAIRKKRINKVTVEQGVIDDFDKKYAENCDQTKMRYKHRNVSLDSPFNPRNKPPD